MLARHYIEAREPLGPLLCSRLQTRIEPLPEHSLARYIRIYGEGAFIVTKRP